jgi:DNA-binding transcriptional LysR family regulator
MRSTASGPKAVRKYERLGVRLLNRSSRPFSVREIGREFYDRCVAMLAAGK